MAEFSWDGFDDLSRKLGQLAEPDPETVRPLMERWEQIIYDDNRRGLLAGLDKDGQPLIPLQSKRKGKYKGAQGPVLSPFSEHSRAIANLVTAHLQDAQGRYVAFGAWDDANNDGGPNYADLIAWHAVGAGNLPIRDVIGIRPDGVREAETALEDWIDNLSP